MRIPFSQLRFTAADEQTGDCSSSGSSIGAGAVDVLVHAEVGAGRRARVRRSHGAAWPSPGRQLELLPYVLSQGTFQPDSSNPFVGDARWMRPPGSTPLPHHVEPHADGDSQSGLRPGRSGPGGHQPDGVRNAIRGTWPFFVEGASSFRFGGTVGGPSAAAASVLSTAPDRPGAAARHRDDQRGHPLDGHDLGAAKVAGKTASGWSVGVLNAPTAPSTAVPDCWARPSAPGRAAEPTTSSAASTASSAGARPNRRHRHATNRGLPSDARSGALLREARTAAAWTSCTNGRTALEPQRIPRRQPRRGEPDGASSRPSDCPRGTTSGPTRITRDRPTATSMSGVAGSVQMRKAAGLHWTSDSWIQFVSPGYEINDIGFLQRSDRRAFGNGITYNQRTPRQVLARLALHQLRELRAEFRRRHDRPLLLDAARDDAPELLAGGRERLVRSRNARTTGSRAAARLANRPAVARYIGLVRSDVRKPITGSLEYNLVTDRPAAATATGISR